jgi:hypothetical protein
MGEMRISSFWLKIFKGTYHLEGLGIDWKVILEWILQKYGERVWMYSTDSG